MSKCVPAIVFSVILANLGAMPAAEKPKPPYVKAQPLGTTWTVDIKTSDVELQPKDEAGNPLPPAPNAPKSKVSVPIKMTCHSGTNGIQVFKTLNSDGYRDEFFVVKRQTLRLYPGTQKVAVVATQDAFPGLEWLAPGGAFVGEEEVDKKPCYKFKVTEAYIRSIPLDPDTEYFAWIEITTGFPVQVKYNEVLYRFSPVTPWPEKVELPAVYKAAMKKIEQQQRALEVMRAQNAR